ncbi:MAG: S46 family peptidase [Bacteroidetes bacterium]|nr:S46 family peptidase [Bacteroidota bacterium]
MIKFAAHIFLKGLNYKRMKKLLLSFLAAVTFLQVKADEGMWIPSLIGKNYDEMVRMGLKLSKDDLYSINHSSLKDAVVQFGGGCTAEMISANGLLITNHHCGYGAIAGLSTIEHNYLDNGFWAYSKEQELPAKDLSVIFLERVEDVTAQINAATRRYKGDKQAKKLEEVIKKIEEKAAENKKYVANVKEYFNGNQYLLLVYKKYTDVRLVGNPPKSIGKFGGDTDNWMWPRHTADFSMFRVYAGKDNEPAEYATDNVPYKPKKYLPINIKGPKEGDYTMIFGYPGRTNRYEVSYGVEVAIKDVNPSIVKIRGKRLDIMKAHMDKDKTVYLKLTSMYASIANYWKYFIGQTEQLKRLHVVDQKMDNEAAFTKWAYKNAPEYKGLMRDFSKIYNGYNTYAKHAVYYSECFKAPALAKLGASTEKLYEELDKENPNQDTIKKHVDAIKSARKSIMKIFDKGTETELTAEMLKMFYQDIPKSQHPSVYERVIFKKFGGDDMDKTFRNYAAYLMDNNMFLDSNKFNAFCAHPTLEKMDEDPVIVYALSFVYNYTTYYEPKVDAFAKRKKELAKEYVRGLMEMNKNKLFYPDANSTMRITYGKVLSYSPQDAVHYDYFTTLDGYVAKIKPGDDEFDSPKELVDLYKKKDYGMYVDADGTLHTDFITNNDITGGNSGSPIINGNGEWIGIAFDGNWEAMSGDIAFDKNYKRTICTDARFILFLIDKLGKAHNLIEEMEIRK